MKIAMIIWMDWVKRNADPAGRGADVADWRGFFGMVW